MRLGFPGSVFSGHVFGRSRIKVASYTQQFNHFSIIT